MKPAQAPVYVCGIGPGSLDFVLPAVHDAIRLCPVVAGGRRQLEMFPLEGKRQIVLGAQLEAAVDEIARLDCPAAVLVSGDTGFYSMLALVRAKIGTERITVLPGISSFQYLFACAGLGYERAYLGSAHGRDMDIVGTLRTHGTLFLLTDGQRNWKTIAALLVEKGMGSCRMIIGSRLSYPDQRIEDLTASQALQLEMPTELCSIIVIDETIPPSGH